MGEHVIDGEFQSDKYPTCPRGKVPLSCKDVTAQDLLWEYAQRRRVVDAAFAGDLETALLNAGYIKPSASTAAGDGWRDIATHDGTTTHVLGWSEKDGLHETWFFAPSSRTRDWWIVGGGNRKWRPTHWQPLLAKPAPAPMVKEPDE